jgi:hypothetical protein
VTVRIGLFAMATALALLLGAGGADAQHAEVTGLGPSIPGSLACDVGCVDSYEIKCLQASRTLKLVIEDLGTPDCFSVTLLGTSPVSMGGAADSVEVCAASALVSLTRPTSTEGTMKALATVHAFSSTAAARDYKVTALCETGAGVARSVSLVRKRDE